MTTDLPTARRFPLGMTLATAAGLAILVSLGLWQVQRLAWKEALLARIARLDTAAAVEAAPTLLGARAPADLDMVRVRLDCPGIATAPFVELYGLKDGQAGRRLISACPLPDGRYGSLLVDRGFIPDGVEDRPAVGAGPAQAGEASLTGVLRVPDRASFFTPPADPAKRLWFARDIPAMAATLGAARPAPVMLMAETATNPGFAALAPSPVPAEISNRHLEYALTWFGLAAALAGVYAARLRKHYRS
ncbi:MAG: SURF1 family protein [Phenylobacterium sp.]